jgi:hypothetical protein
MRFIERSIALFECINNPEAMTLYTLCAKEEDSLPCMGAASQSSAARRTMPPALLRAFRWHNSITKPAGRCCGSPTGRNRCKGLCQEPCDSRRPACVVRGLRTEPAGSLQSRTCVFLP